MHTHQRPRWERWRLTLLMVCLILPEFHHDIVSTAVYVGVMVLLLQLPRAQLATQSSHRLLQIGLASLLIVGISSADFSSPHFRSSFLVRDIWMALRPILIAIIGATWVAVGGTLRELKKATVLASVAVAVHVLLAALSEIHTLREGGISLYRQVSGLSRGGSQFLLPIGAMMAWTTWKEKTPRGHGHRKPGRRGPFVAAILVIAAVATGSRTLVIVTAVIGATSAFYQKPRAGRRRRTWWPEFAVIAGFLLISVSLAAPSLPKALGAAVRSSAIELTKSNFGSESDINLQFRSYERHRALTEFGQFSIWRSLVGGGYGYWVDAIVPVPVGKAGTFTRELPILHDGFALTLIKSGVAGLCLLVFLLVRLAMRGVRDICKRSCNDPAIRMLGAIPLGIICVTPSVSGIFNSELFDSLLLLHISCIYLLSGTRTEAVHQSVANRASGAPK
jgi:hypothetical protein